MHIKKLLLTASVLGVLVMSGCSSTTDQAGTADPLEEFDRQAKTLILDLDANQIEDLKGQGETIQVNGQ